MVLRELGEEVEQPADYLGALHRVVDAYGTYGGRMDYDDGMYTGALDVWSDCRGTEAVVVIIAAEPRDGSMLVEVEVQLVSGVDEEALWTIIGSIMAC